MKQELRNGKDLGAEDELSGGENLVVATDACRSSPSRGLLLVHRAFRGRSVWGNVTHHYLNNERIWGMPLSRIGNRSSLTTTGCDAFISKNRLKL
jgi:hypothetical protein